jgi:hypothetical protein
MEQLWGSQNLLFTATMDKGNSDVIDTGMTSFGWDVYWRKLKLMLVDVGP